MTFCAGCGTLVEAKVEVPPVAQSAPAPEAFIDRATNKIAEFLPNSLARYATLASALSLLGFVRWFAILGVVLASLSLRRKEKNAVAALILSLLIIFWQSGWLIGLY